MKSSPVVRVLAALYAWVGDNGERECVVSAEIPDHPSWPLMADTLDAAQSARDYIQAMATQYQTSFRLVVFGAAVTLETIEPKEDDDD